MTMELSPDQLAGSLGIPMFTSDMHMPAYIEGTNGRWRLFKGGFLLDRGYYSGLWGVAGMPALLRDTNGDGRSWETWMSLSPHEIESQELGCRYACGHTVVMGLGMGWVAINMALNPAVELVTIIERDPEVIELFGQSGALHGLADNVTAKIRIIRADALEWRPGEKVDFLYADIWRCLEEPQTVDNVRRMQANIGAEVIYFWGQELAIHSLAERKPAACAEGEWAAEVRRCVTDVIALPLLLPDDFDYPAMIADVVRLRQQRRPGTVPDKSQPMPELRPIVEDDTEFLVRLYASTRAGEQELFGWDDAQWDAFIRSQFDLQHAHYQQNYQNASFDLILLAGKPAGRLYVSRGTEEIRIIDISVSPEYRGKGIGRRLLEALNREGDTSGVPVTLHVEKHNPALNLYLQLGFTVVEDRGFQWFMERNRHICTTSCPPQT